MVIFTKMPIKTTTSSKTQTGGAASDWAELTLTPRCNQRCFFCYEDRREDAKEPDLEEVKRLLRETSKRADLAVLCGKEVLLRPDIIQIIEYAVSLDLDVCVFTNGQALAKEGMVEALAEAGCRSVVVSFHFPDAETFARGARVPKKGFERTMAGFDNIRKFNLKHPSGPFHIATETDMFILNAGRLSEMRQTLLDALGDSPWRMRIGSLMPSQVHHIGLEHVLESFTERREELQAFIQDHPAHVPLNFVKTPLCLLPPGEEHRCLEVGYVYGGTILTLNHEQQDKITLDSNSTSTFRNIDKVMRAHPYRWVCRSCNLAPLCRFERLDWSKPYFHPTREQKPVPRQSTTVSEVLSRMGPDQKALTRMEEPSRVLREELRFPEEDLLAALSSTLIGEPELVDAWIDRKPMMVIEFKHDGHLVQLQLGAAPKQADGEVLGMVIDYLDVRPVNCDGVPEQIVRACLSTVARRRFPDIEQWAADHFFDPETALVLRAVWQNFEERIWPGFGRFGVWRTESVRLFRANKLVVQLLHPASARAQVTCQVENLLSVEITVVADEHAQELPLDDCRELLSLIGGLLTGSKALPAMLSVERFRSGRLPVRFKDGGWVLQGAGAGDEPSSGEELLFCVRDRAAQNAEYRFYVTAHRPDRPYFKRVGGLVLWYSHSEMTPSATAFASVLLTAMERSRLSPLDEENLSLWHQAVDGLLKTAGIAGQFEWTVSLRNR